MRLDGTGRSQPEVKPKNAKSPSSKPDDPSPAVETGVIAERKTVLSELDTSQTLDSKNYKKSLAKYQGQLNLLQRKAKNRNVSTILVFEGWDAGGKGGAIRRITSALDAREAQVIPIAAPTDEEKAHHYLWRFWRHLPRAGRITIFDRSWYGRVLVERVEGFATEEEWARAYTEINAFERQLVEHDVILLKFWLHISKEEQLQRFKAREETPFKRWKITEEDWRNREKWDEYEMAVHAMVERTSTEARPWILVEGNDKKYARIKVLRTLCERLDSSVE
jgi:polyphosphate kinase 2 (PPK2 family)